MKRLNYQVIDKTEMQDVTHKRFSAEIPDNSQGIDVFEEKAREKLQDLNHAVIFNHSGKRIIVKDANF